MLFFSPAGATSSPLLRTEPVTTKILFELCLVLYVLFSKVFIPILQNIQELIKFFHLKENLSDPTNYWNPPLVYDQRILEHHLQNRMECFLGAVALALLHLDGLARRLHLDPVEVQVEAGDLAESVRSLHELSVSLQLSVAGNLRPDNKVSNRQSRISQRERFPRFCPLLNL